MRRNAEKHIGLRYQHSTPREVWRQTHSCQRLEPLSWNRETAYAVGLIATDGNLSKSGRHVHFISSDLDLVETFLHCVGHRINYRTICRQHRRPTYEAAFSDVELYRWLQDAGLTQRKSLTLGALLVPGSFLPDVVRGLLDGDGSIATKCYCRGRRSVHRHVAVVFHSASRPHLEWLATQLNGALSVVGHLSRRTRTGRADLHRLTYPTNDARRILEWVYLDEAAPKLRRKWESWMDYRRRVGDAFGERVA